MFFSLFERNLAAEIFVKNLQWAGMCGETLAHCFCPLPALLTNFNPLDPIRSRRFPGLACHIPTGCFRFAVLTFQLP